MADLTHPRLVTAVVIAIVVVAVAWIAISVARWRRITWRDHMDTQISAMPREARESGPWAIWKVFTNHEEVASPSLVLLRISNSGLRAIAKADVRRPLTFSFPDRVVKEFTVTDCRGVSRQEIQPPGDLNSPQDADDTISLPSFAMRRRAGFKLLVLLSGGGRGIVVNGGLRRGQVLHGSRVRGPLTQNIAFGSVLLLLLGIQAGFTFGQGPALPSYCASGSLDLKGSTAFAPTATIIAKQYTGVCTDAKIKVSAISTFNGLNAVQQTMDDGGKQGTSAAGTQPGRDVGTAQVAMSDGPAPAGYPNLVGYPVAVILFAVVVNVKDHVYNLTTAQLQAIWRGDINNWDQLDGPNLPIVIVARTTASGTRRTFDRKVLQQPELPFSSYNCGTKNALPDALYDRCEVADTNTLLQKVDTTAGAIGYAQVSDASNPKYNKISSIKIDGSDPLFAKAQANLYNYWTAETLYTAGPPVPGTLEFDFLHYLNTTPSNDLLQQADYTPCLDGSKDLRSTMCNESVGSAT
jgi:phosphate transport system substrate-binding protein